MSDQVTLISFLLDETGSMHSIKDDTICGFNTYLDSLKDPSKGAVEFTLLKFDSNAITKVYVGAPISDVQPLTPETYRPGASTPLIDAAYKIIKATEEVISKRQDTPLVLVVIQTDGQENASTEHTSDELNQLVKEKTAAGWGFVFLGAGIDAFTQARAWGLNAASTMSYGRGDTRPTFDALASNTAHYRSSGQVGSLGFTSEQRSASGDIYHQDPDNPHPMTPAAVASPAVIPPPAPRVRKPIVEDFSLVPEESKP